MLGNDVEMSLFSTESWAPNHFVLGAQVAPVEKKVSLYL